MSVFSVVTQCIAAGLGTAAFALLFGVPQRLYAFCAGIGGLGWLFYFTLHGLTAIPEVELTFLATVLVVLMSRFCAVYERCPATVFVTTGIFPLIPGAGIYWTAWYLISGQSRQALVSGASAVKGVFAIVLGIVVVFELPQKLFSIAARKEKK